MTLEKGLGLNKIEMQILKGDGDIRANTEYHSSSTKNNNKSTAYQETPWGCQIGEQVGEQ